ncbi:FAD assembly factor SdhE [Candidatus Steffania adelgidicola]|uniref:FAD assembly factor SdhE n=1 Tax=Candidatus Steffania adelgidicola TaxID=1076626 RepID=UPI001D02C5E4|nr:FAD assembly factor SdhE [Candidatus Steffania adelgidicola]UDG79977.1 FAD assembly factor SdhE [Candidatus Steffania adelgidicola]
MDIANKSRIYWACRRGMRELDITIMPFFEKDFDSLDNQNKQRFVRLLEFDDPDLFDWLINQSHPEDDDLCHIISIIQEKNKTRTL